MEDKFFSLFCYSLIIVLFFTGPVLGQTEFKDIRLEREVRRAFYESLGEGQRIDLLRDIEQTLDYTPRELGAKYRWGYIPADRTPPAALAEWWRSLSERERDKRRLSWFRRNYQRLDVDRAARILGLKPRLNKIQRRYERQWKKRPGSLEDVDFSLAGSGRDPGEETGEQSRSPAAVPPRGRADKSPKAEQTPEPDSGEEPPQEPDVKKVTSDTAGPNTPGVSKEVEPDTTADETASGSKDRTDTAGSGKETITSDSETKPDRRRFYWTENNRIKVLEEVASGTNVDKTNRENMPASSSLEGTGRSRSLRREEDEGESRFSERSLPGDDFDGMETPTPPKPAIKIPPPPLRFNNL